MKERLLELKYYLKNKWVTLAILLPGLLACIYFTYQGIFLIAAAIAALPILIAFVIYSFRHPIILFIVVFTINYGIMGIGRYISIPLPTSVLMDGCFILLLIAYCFHLFRGKSIFKSEIIPFLLLYGIWLTYCLIQAFNNTAGIGFQFTAWFKDVRPMAFHALLIILVFSLVFNKSKHIKYFLYLWGGFIVLAAIKAYCQYKYGFDEKEMQWLLSGPIKTHIIHSGIRYFSFFSDAANFGSNMAFSLVTFAICFYYEKGKYTKWFYLLVALAALYGMMLSGTRSAMIVALCGFLMYTLLSRSPKLFFSSLVLLIATVCILKFTTIGNSSSFVRRMRTAFNPQDASLQVRLNNQKAIKAYMKEAPWGIGMGIGMGSDQLPQNNKYWIVSITAPDSTLVYIWMRTGAVGIAIFLLVLAGAIIAESFIVLFRIKDKQLRGILTAFTCGSACMIVAAYGNFIYHQYPNTLLVFGLQTLVFMGPYFDRQLTAEKEQKALEQQHEIRPTEEKDT